MRLTLTNFALALILAAACGKDEPAPVAPSVAENPQGTKPEPQAQAEVDDGPKLSAAEVPLAEDFAPEAAQQITKANYRAELDVLAEEIEHEPH